MYRFWIKGRVHHLLERPWANGGKHASIHVGFPNRTQDGTPVSYND
jgi:hypothetical protein